MNAQLRSKKSIRSVLPFLMLLNRKRVFRQMKSGSLHWLPTQSSLCSLILVLSFFKLYRTCKNALMSSRLVYNPSPHFSLFLNLKESLPQQSKFQQSQAKVALKSMSSQTDRLYNLDQEQCSHIVLQISHLHKESLQNLTFLSSIWLIQLYLKALDLRKEIP